MKTKTLNKVLLYVEVVFYGFCGILFMILNFFGKIGYKQANIIYILFILISFGSLFTYEFLFPKLDNAVHYKMLKKYYEPVPNARMRESYKRKGIYAVITLWIAYLLFVSFLKYLKVLSWQIFLSGMSLLFLLNSIFIRKKCLLSVLFLHNKNNCCKNCGINCWDYAIFSSALFFAPYMSPFATVLNAAVIIVSLIMLIVWEYNYHKYPFRFYPETNRNLNCKNCAKKCHENRKLKQQ